MSTDMRLSAMCRVKSSAVEEDGNKGDAIVITKFSGVASKGMFTNFSADLENVVFEKKCFKGMNTGEVVGHWLLKLYADTGEILCTIKQCQIKNISLNVNTSDNSTNISVKIVHPRTLDQSVIDNIVSTTVQMVLVPDTEALGISNDMPEYQKTKADEKPVVKPQPLPTQNSAVSESVTEAIADDGAMEGGEL